ncbi:PECTINESTERASE [Salix purpurea]|uniref:Pectinesterase n=1 Tax=Salix purpurea TaxID=77065 RepID=A0A9Q0W8P8_SALPP|nr:PECTINESTERASE [Salix purpurea]
MAIELAMQRALHAQNHNKWLGPKCRNGKEKAAWADCLRLYQDTIAELNRTIPGFRDFGVSDFVLPLMSNNVSKLIRNTLALKDNASSTLPQTYEDSFPGWLKTGDRKLLQTSSPTPNLVVAQDGSGNYRTIKAALDAAAKRSGSRRYTIITGSRSVGGGFTTFNSATVAVTGEGFIARGITFRNTAGPQNHQAVALRSGSDLSVFYRCGFEGYQDTLYVHSQRQFYRECYIYGTVDFIFGNAAVVLQNCMIYARRPMAQQKNVVTAQGRTDPNQNTGNFNP